jgi:hypothetical protein
MSQSQKALSFIVGYVNRNQLESVNLLILVLWHWNFFFDRITTIVT